MKQGFGCALGLVNVEGKKPGELETFLLSNYKIHITTVDYEGLKGVRVTPNVYTTTKNLDTLVRLLKSLRKGGF